MRSRVHGTTYCIPLITMDERTELQRYRKRALELVAEKSDKDTPTLLDYQIDGWLRGVYDLPTRPQSSEPYFSWITPPKEPSDKIKKTSQRGIDLIKEFEGFRAKAYFCPANVLTIGYGHTSTCKPGQVISTTKGEELLKEDLVRFENAVNVLVKVPLTQGQFDALVSFAFNVGVGAFKGSTLLRLLNEGKYASAVRQFKRWVHGGGRKLPGLVRRRKAERELFLS